MNSIHKAQEALRRNLQEIEEGHDLAHYAALEAARVLVENWSAALRDGEQVRNLVGDVYEVVHILQEFQKAVVKESTP